VGGLNTVTTMDDFLEDEAEAEAQLFRDGGNPVRARWASGRRTLSGHRLRQASLASWALPPADAVILLDLLEYDLDTAVIVDLDACDAKSFHAACETAALPCAGVTGKLQVPTTNSSGPGCKGRELLPLECHAPSGANLSTIPTEASARSRRLDILTAKRNGSFVFSHVVVSGKHTVSPFAITAGHPRLPGLMEVIQYSPIIRPYVPTKRKFKVRIDGPVAYSLRPESFSGKAGSLHPPISQVGADAIMQAALTVVNTPCPGSSGMCEQNNEIVIRSGAGGSASPIYHVESPSEAMVVYTVGSFSLSSDSTSGVDRILSRRVGPA